jgi:hypothetical protein
VDSALVATDAAALRGMRAKRRVLLVRFIAKVGGGGAGRGGAGRGGAACAACCAATSSTPAHCPLATPSPRRSCCAPSTGSSG